MKEEITSLELKYATIELQELIGGRIDKIYQLDREFLLTMHVRVKGRKRLKIMSNAVYLTDYKEEFPETPPGFCAFLRKRLNGSIIKSIEQKNFERILEIKFEAKEQNYVMIIELFAQGNVVLCSEDYKIISALESHKWKDRTVRGGIEYEFPPTQTNVTEMNHKEFVDTIKNSDMDSIVKTLAVNMGLGGLYAEELCVLSGIDKTKEKISPGDTKKLYDNLQKLLKKKLKPNMVDKEILPFELKSLKKAEKYFETFSEAMDSKFSKKMIASHSNKSEEKKNVELKKIQAIIDQQEKTIKGLEISDVENTKKGEFIYENYEKIKKILDDMNIARDKFSWEEIKEELKNHKIIKQVNEKEGTIVIDV